MCSRTKKDRSPAEGPRQCQMLYLKKINSRLAIAVRVKSFSVSSWSSAQSLILKKLVPSVKRVRCSAS